MIIEGVVLMNNVDFGKDLSEFVKIHEPELRRKFKQNLYGCEKSSDCFGDSLQNVFVDMLKNPPIGWELFTVEHKINLIAKAMKYKGLKLFSKCSDCNKNKYQEVEEKDKIIKFASPYENETLIRVTHIIIQADRRGRLTTNEIKVLDLILMGLELKEIAERIGETYENVRAIKSRAVKKLKGFVD